MRDHVPVAAGVLEKLLEHRRVLNIKFTRELSLAHVMLDWVQGKQRTRQQYADIWGWSKSAVVREMPNIFDDAEKLLSFRMAALLDDSDREDLSRETMLELFPGMPKSAPVGSESYEKPKRLHNKLFFTKDTWQYKFALAFHDQMAREGVVPQGYKNAPLKAMQNYADAFDKLHRIDGHKIDTIKEVVRYLFSEDDWWIENRNIQSADKLRRKKDKDGHFIFDRLLISMRKNKNGVGRRTREVFTAGLEQSTRETLDILRANEEARRSSDLGHDGASFGGRGDAGDQSG